MEELDETAEVVTALAGGDWDKFAQLVTEFEKVHGVGSLWPALALVQGANLDVFERLLAWPAQGRRVALRKLMPVVEHVHGVSVSDGMRFLEFADQVDPQFRYVVAAQLRPHIARDHSLGIGLGQGLRAGRQRKGALRVWAGAFTEAAPEQAIEYALLLMAGADRDIEILGTLLQFLPLRDATTEALIRPHQEQLTAALVTAAPSLGDDAWLALTAIKNFSVAAMNALMAAVEAGELSAVAAVADDLFRAQTTTVGATAVPLRHLVETLLRVAVGQPETSRSIDSGVASLLRRDGLHIEAMPGVIGLGAIAADVAEQFSATFDALYERPDDFSTVLTHWLVGEGITFPAIRSLLSRCILHPGLARIDNAIFMAVPPMRRAVAARRLLALTHNGPLLCRFIADLAETPALQPDGLQIAAFMLNDAYTEYPEATFDFLRERIDSTSRTEPFASVYKGVYATAQRWQRVLMRLPTLNELRPIDGQLHALRGMKLRINRDIMRAVEQRSVFASMVTNVHVAQGRRFTSHSANLPLQIAEMQAASHSMELPSSELADPVGGALRRAKLLSASR